MFNELCGRNGATAKPSLKTLLLSLSGKSYRCKAVVYNWNASAAFNEFSWYVCLAREAEFIGWDDGVFSATQLGYSIVNIRRMV